MYTYQDAVDASKKALDQIKELFFEISKRIIEKDLNDAMSKAAADTLAADKKAFEEYKEEHKQKADSLAKEDDSQASKPKKIRF